MFENLAFVTKFVVGHLEPKILGSERIRHRDRLSASLPRVLGRSMPGATVTYSLSRGLVNSCGGQGRVEIGLEQDIPSNLVIK